MSCKNIRALCMLALLCMGDFSFADHSTSCNLNLHFLNLEGVFHGSPVGGMKSILPHVSTHGENWVYGTPYLGVAAAYLGRWGDFDLNQRISNGRPVLTERYPGALKSIFSGKKGSLYQLKSEGFQGGKTGFGGEVVKTGEVLIEEELAVTDTYQLLLDLQKAGKLDLYFYPDRPAILPQDDQDLVDKAVKWIKMGKAGILENLSKWHPELVSKVKAQL